MARRSRKKKSYEPVDVTIESLSHEGRGITHIDGKTVFVSAALEGEKVTIQIQKSNKNFDEAKVVSVQQASELRIEPKCEYFGLCGGCSMQHLSTENQLELKQKAVFEMFQHAGIKDYTVIPALFGDAWGYRQKARLGVKFVIKKDKVLVGFREKNSPFLTDMDSCQILHSKVGLSILDLKNLIENLDSKQSIPQIEVAADDKNVTLVFRHLEILSQADKNVLIDFAKKTGFYIQLQSQGPDSIENLYPENQQLTLKPYDGIEIEFKATDFTQVNSDMNRAMIQQALRYLEPKKDEKIIDFFCGLGNFSLPMASMSQFVTGVEGSDTMVNRALQNAKSNGLENCEFFSADLSKPFKDQAWTKLKVDKILLDPARIGAKELVEEISCFKAQKIVYVSCQPTSLVRDAVILKDQSYKMTHLGVMDMFPQTAHIETMAVFEKV